MSLIQDSSLQPKIYKDYPNIVKNVDPAMKVMESVRNYSAFDEDATSSSSRGLQFQFSPVSYDTVVNRKMKVSTYLTMHLEFRPTSTFSKDTNLWSPAKMCLRDHPLQRLFQNPKIKINNELMNVDLEQTFQGQNIFMYDDCRANSYQVPNNIDIGYANYNDATASNATPLNSFENFTLQSLHSPDGAYKLVGFRNPNNGQIITGAQNAVYSTSGGTPIDINSVDPDSKNNSQNLQLADDLDPGANSTSIPIYPVYYLESTVWVSPLLYNGQSGMSSQGLWSVNNISLNLDTVDTPKIFRNVNVDPGTAPGAPLSLVSEAYAGNNTFKQSKLHYQAMQPPWDLTLPDTNTLLTYEYQSYRILRDALNSKSRQTGVQSDLVQVHTIPDMIMLQFRPPKSELTSRDADFHFVPEKVSFRIGNEQNILRTFSQSDLFDMVRAKAPIPWSCFSGEAINRQGELIATSGSPLLFKIGEDLPVDAGLANGVQTHTQIQASADIYNQTDDDYNNVEVVLTLINSQFLYNNKGQSDVFSAFLTSDDVLKAQEWRETEDPEQSIGGAKSKSMFKNLASGVSKLGKQVAKDVGKKAVNRATDRLAKNLV